MIVRILTEGQYRFPAAELDELNSIDNQIVDLVAVDDEEGFRELFDRMLEMVRSHGEPLPMDEIEESDAIIPEPDITLEEAKELFVGVGVVPD